MASSPESDPAPLQPSGDPGLAPDPETPGSPDWRYRDGYLRLIRGWWAGLEPLLPIHQTLLDSRLTPEEALARGSSTTAREVVDETLNALARLQVVEVVSAHETDMHYSKTRLRYLFDQLLGLHEAVQQQSLQADLWSEAQARLQRDVESARVQRNRLIQGFEAVLDLLPELRTEFDNRRGASAPPAALAASVAGLASLLESWHRNPNIAPALQLAMFGLEHVTAARTAAENLEQSRTDAVQAPAAPRDLPATNVLEGRLLSELHTLYRALHHARSVVPTLPGMALGKTLLRAFGRISTATPAPEPVAKPDAEPAEPVAPTPSV